MKKFFAWILLIVVASTFAPSVEAQSADVALQVSAINDAGVITADINDEDSLKVVHTKRVKHLDDKLFEDDPEKIKLILKLQKEKDVEDLESLWGATVGRNSAIRFALQKIAAPEEQRKVHSSLMAKTLSALINGASLIPFMMGASYGMQTASIAGGQVANKLMSKRRLPKKSPLTDTELIQLSNLVEDLQNKLVKGYYDYKSAISSLKECREKLIVEKKNYAKACSDKNDFYIIVASAVYDDKLLEEEMIKQEVKLNRLKLERLAGHDAVEALNLSRILIGKR